MNFDPGNMDICIECENERYCDEGDLLYCALGGKPDSSQCERYTLYLRVRGIVAEIGRALDKLDPQGLDPIYAKDRVIERVADALGDYYPEVWTDDLTYELQVPGNGALKDELLAQGKWK